MKKERIDVETIKKAKLGNEVAIRKILEFYRPFIIHIYYQTEHRPNSYDLDEFISMCYLKIYKRTLKFQFSED